MSVDVVLLRFFVREVIARAKLNPAHRVTLSMGIEGDPGSRRLSLRATGIDLQPHRLLDFVEPARTAYQRRAPIALDVPGWVKPVGTKLCAQLRLCSDGRAYELAIATTGAELQTFKRASLLGRPRDLEEITAFVSPNALKTNWLELTLFEDAEVAEQGPAAWGASPAEWVAAELSSGFFQLPVQIAIVRDDDAGGEDEPLQSRLVGETAVSAKQIIDAGDGVQLIFACPMSSGAKSVGAPTGVTGVVFRDEIFDARTGDAWREQFERLGVRPNRNDVSILVKLPDDYPVSVDEASLELTPSNDEAGRLTFDAFVDLIRTHWSYLQRVEAARTDLESQATEFDASRIGEDDAAGECAEFESDYEDAQTTSRGLRVDESEPAFGLSAENDPWAASNRVAPELSELVDSRRIAAAQTLRLKICIVTNELAEFHQNGGLGTANSGLVHALAERGFAPTVLYTNHMDLKSAAIQSGLTALTDRGIEFFALQNLVPAGWMGAPERISFACYWFLREASFDVVHFNDYLGNGYYCSLARRTGAAFQQTTIIVTVHGPTRWAAAVDERPFFSLAEQKISLLEHKTLEFADVVLGVSHHLVKWLRERGVALPRHTFVHKNILPTSLAGVPGSGVVEPGKISNIVFFARQDVRKGFLLMLEAIRLVAARMPEVKFTFLGKFSRIYGEHSGALALDELAEVANLVNFIPDYDRNRAIQYLRKPGTLAVIPSLDENSPCTVFECIVGGIPFIASDVGGIPELVAAKDRDAVLFEANGKALAAKLLEVVVGGLPKVSLGFDPSRIEQDMFRGFAALHEIVSEETRAARAVLADVKPFVSVVITHFNRAAMLRQLLRTLENQTYKHFEVIVVDDGSTYPEAVAYIQELKNASFKYPFTLVPIKNCYLGAARNVGVKHARGEFVKFQDDDNIPMPYELEYFVRAALTSGADIVTAMARFFHDEAELKSPIELSKFDYFPMGASLPLSLFRNEYGDANSLVRREAFVEDGGFTEIYDVGFEDYEYFVKSESRGRKLMLVPEPIFNYRVSDGSMLRSTSAYRGAKRARSGISVMSQQWVEQLVDFAQEMQLGKDVGEQARWRAGRRRHGELHQAMMEGDPGGKANIERFVDLAVRFERYEDVLPLVLRGNPLYNSLSWLEQKSHEFAHRDHKLLRLRGQVRSFGRLTHVELIEPKTKLPNFDLVKAEETGILVHPIVDRTVAARVRGALPKKLKYLAVSFSHRGAQGRPVMAQIAISAKGREIVASEWTVVPPGQMAEVVLSLKNPLAVDGDLILRTLVEGKQDYCWVYADQMRTELHS